ncbi:MAG: alpha-hydroxy-acid oxidizing protein [Gammaproteobacteria bacterium]|nr:MAG: alpha-hydroxy-acid oxidizing protein [Gammaproteobacteria bacterium]RLA35579.1 MAG: alpha-hydroxy-acid oxidizing protein [Gammaproteobacteria bacterium]
MELEKAKSRRQFLRYLAASPICSALAGIEFAEGATDTGQRIASPADALDIFDLQATASEVLPPAHYGYMATGVNNDGTLRANRAAFEHYYLRSRRLVDVSKVDTSVKIFGETWPTPIVVAPVGSQRAFHSDGEIATARAARSRGHLQILSTVSSTPIEEVAAARDAPIWFQLYTLGGWPGVRRMLRRAEAAGCPAVVLTVDMPTSAAPARHTLERARLQDSRDCSACHEGSGIAAGEKPMFDGIEDPEIDRRDMPLTWDFLEQLRQETTMKVLVKGIVTAEDAERCVEYGVDGIIVSNHGGRADDSGRGALDSLAEVAPAVKGRTLLLMDSGIRRGTDILKALALGADAIMVGRPYVWGLGAFGQPGVERALEILHSELTIAMEFAGIPSIDRIGPDAIGQA